MPQRARALPTSAGLAPLVADARTAEGGIPKYWLNVRLKCAASVNPWRSPKKGQFAKAWEGFFADTGSRLYFAGSDWAKGWNSFVDGAIETGLAVAR